MSETTHDPQGFEDAEAAERRRMAAQDEDALQADVDLDADEYWMAETDEFLLTRDEAEARRWLAIGHDVRRVRVHITDSATPPTPDRAAVREALVRILEDAVPSLMTDLCEAVGVDFLDADCSPRVADALLRPAPLPTDVQAAVESTEAHTLCTVAVRDEIAKRKFSGTTFSADEMVSTVLRTLLAHLTRTEG